jgi:hypothetical protein
MIYSLYKDWKVLILIPSFFSSMLCLAVQSGINGMFRQSCKNTKP